jgi:heptosyltransferase-3
LSLPEPNSAPEAPKKRPLRYRLDRLMRKLAMRVIVGVASGQQTISPDLRGQDLKRILLVRANFRMGNVILTLPAIAAFRRNFPQARIDYAGSPMSRVLFQNQPLDGHYETPRRFPRALWQFVSLIRRLRASRYDLALDVSCSQSALASLMIGLSGARIRAGCAGKWDALYNLRIDRLAEPNKYRKLTKLLTALGLDAIDEVGRLEFSASEVSEGHAALARAVGKVSGPIVGVFTGGRKLRGKRWPLENFVEVVVGLAGRGFRVVTFLGPEEADIADKIKGALGPGAILVAEPSVRKFASMVSQLDLFICCDSGPMHLACAVGVRVLAIFRDRDLYRWSPPASVARTVSSAAPVSAGAVLSAALEELSANSRSRGARGS